MNPIIVGAGPIGCNLARLLKGLSPVLLESRSRVGVPVHCTGLVSTRLQSLTNYPDSLVLNRVTGAKLFSRNECVTLDANHVMAHVIDRRSFDEWMYKESGIKAHLGESFSSVSNGRVLTSKGEYSTDLVIDCSGPKRESRCLLGVQAVVPIKRPDNLVELYFDVVPDFFAWVVPISERVARVGLASMPSNNPMRVLKSFLSRINAGRPREWNAGLIPLSVNDFVSDGFVRCGDSAGQVKAVSGGGLVTGILSSSILARAVLKAYEKGDFSKSFFVHNYVNPWNASIGRELWLHARLRRYLDKCDYDELLRFIITNKSVFEQFGDVDFMSSLVSRLLRLGNLPFLVKSVFKLLFS